MSASSTRTPTTNIIDVSVGGTSVSNIISATLSVQNDIQWTPYETLHNSLSVTNASNAMYPSGFTLGRRVVSGNITNILPAIILVLCKALIQTQLFVLKLSLMVAHS